MIPQLKDTGCRGIATDSMLNVLQKLCKEQGVEYGMRKFMPLKIDNILSIWYIDYSGIIYCMENE